MSKYPIENKFLRGNNEDGKHYWLTPPDLMRRLNEEFRFDFDPCPYPKPDDFDGLTCEWGASNYVNPPFGSIMHMGKKKGPTAWARKAIEQARENKKVVFVYPIDKWVLMLLAEGARVQNLGDVKWCAIEDGSAGKGTGRHIAAFILDSRAYPEVIAEDVAKLRARIAALEKCIEALGEALEEASEAMSERRGYCEMWEYKYSESWDEEDARVNDAIRRADEAAGRLEKERSI